MKNDLTALFDFLDRLAARPAAAELHDAVAGLAIACDDVAEFIRFSDRGYQRNLVRAGPWYHVWVMCWKNGQRSPIHDHAASSCVMRVLRGTLTETRFERAPNGDAKAVGSRELAQGAWCVTEGDDLHQISNLQAGSADLVTLHIYSPPLVWMTTYSITDTVRGEDVWIEERKFVQAFPENSETPLSSIQGWVTPNRLFFVRNHFQVPTIDRTVWRLRVAGLVETPLELSWEDLSSFPQRNVFATVECAGNGRSFLQKTAPGVQWGAGAVGHAEWTGVPVASILEKAGLKPEALEVVFQGADSGSEADHPEAMNFARSLPLSKALDADTILAFRMNGELLTPNHGFPLRLFVPGWYGVASVKWLESMEVIERPFQGYFQTKKYTVERRTADGVATEIVGPMSVKSEIVRPCEGDTVRLGANRVFGIAWAGEEPVGAVELSTDAGRTWNPAQLTGPRAPYSWTLWEYLWEVAEPGTHVLLARATSAGGKVQPTEHDSLNGGYIIRHSRPTRVEVGGGWTSPARLGDVAVLLYDMNCYAEENARRPLDVELAFTGGEGI